MSEYMYTRRMEQLFDQVNGKLKAFVSREDVAQAREDVLSVPESARIWRMGDLESLCAPLEMDAAALLKDESLLMQIPTRSELKAEMAQAMYDMYREFPTSVDYMKRMVARLAPEYAGDPLRVAILKKFLAGYTHDGTLFETAAIFDWVYDHMDEADCCRADGLKGEALRKFLADKVTDGVFVNLHTSVAALAELEIRAKRYRICMEDPEGCFLRTEDGGKAPVPAMELSEATCRQIADFWAEYMPDCPPDDMLECVEAIAGACREGLVPDVETALEMFIEGFKADIDAQFSQEIAYVKQNARAEFVRHGQEFVDDCVELCLETKYAVGADSETLRQWFGARWNEAYGTVCAIGRLTDEVRQQLAERMQMLADDACVNGPIRTACLQRSRESLARKLGANFVSHVRKTLADMNAPMRLRLKDDRKYIRKLSGKPWELLKIADDLAAGRPRGSDVMKLYLYYFAFMFDMKAAMKYGETADPDRDIVKNLFYDYYSDNLTRYLQQDPAAGNAQEPSGEGINFKNYVEAIYLYYLCRRDASLSAGQWLDKANAMIERCTQKGDDSFAGAGGNTQLFRETHMAALLELPEAQAEEYICRNYQIIPPVKTARILVNSEEITATERMHEIMEWLEEAYAGNAPLEHVQNGNLRGEQHVRVAQLMPRDGSMLDADDPLRWNIWRDDSMFAQNMRFSWELSALLRDRYSGDAGFVQLVNALEKRLDTMKNLELLHDLYENPIAKMKRKDNKDYGYIDSGMETDEDEDAAPGEAKRVTRSGLIALYTHYYTTLLDDTVNFNSFAEMCEDFCSVIDPILEEARYQKISVRNILDVYVLFTLYFYMIEHRDLP